MDADGLFGDTDLLIKSESYLNFLLHVKATLAIPGERKLMKVYGPKHVGKSSALKLLHKELDSMNVSCAPVDLLRDDLDHLHSFSQRDMSILFVDNAQVYIESSIDLSRWKLVIAVFSPSAQLVNYSLEC